MRAIPTWCHVAVGAGDARLLAGVELGAGGGEDAGEAEVGEVRLVGRAEQHVHGLDVAVEDGRHAVVVEVRDGVGDAERDVEARAPPVRGRALGPREAAAVEQPAQAAVGEVAVEQQPGAAVGGPPEEPHDVAVPDGAQRRDLAAERRRRRLVRRPHLLHGQGVAGGGIHLIHDPRAAGADHVRGRQPAEHVVHGDVELLVQRHLPRALAVDDAPAAAAVRAGEHVGGGHQEQRADCDKHGDGYL